MSVWCFRHQLLALATRGRGRSPTAMSQAIGASVSNCWRRVTRHANRKACPWAVKVLGERPEELAFEPGYSGAGRLFLTVVWHR